MDEIAIQIFVVRMDFMNRAVDIHLGIEILKNIDV